MERKLINDLKEMEKFLTEEDVTEEEDVYSEGLLPPCGGVFRGDLGSATKAQVRAANRQWRRRINSGRFHDDGSRWN